MATEVFAVSNNGNTLQPKGDSKVTQGNASKRVIKNNGRNGRGDAANVKGQFMSEVRIIEEFEPYQEEGQDQKDAANGADTCTGGADSSRGYQNPALECSTCISSSSAMCRGDCAERLPNPSEADASGKNRLKCSCPEDPEQRWSCPRCRDPNFNLSPGSPCPSCYQMFPEHFPEYTPQTLQLLRRIRGPESSRPILQRDLRHPSALARIPGGSEACFPCSPVVSCRDPCYGCNPSYPGGEEVQTTTRTKYYKEPTCPKYPDCCPQLIGEEEVSTVKRQMKPPHGGLPCHYTSCAPLYNPYPAFCASPYGPYSPYSPYGPYGPCPPQYGYGPCSPCPTPYNLYPSYGPCGPCSPCPTPCNIYVPSCEPCPSPPPSPCQSPCPSTPPPPPQSPITSEQRAASTEPQEDMSP